MFHTASRIARAAARRVPLAAVLLLVLLGLEFETVTHTHGGVLRHARHVGVSTAPAQHGPERPCAICRLADVSSSAATAPVRIERPLAVAAAGIVPTVRHPLACPEPVRSPRAPPRSVSR